MKFLVMKLLVGLYVFLAWFKPASLAGQFWWFGLMWMAPGVVMGFYYWWIWVLMIVYAVLSALVFLAGLMPGPQ